jgi:carboxypeptidase family protein
MWFVILLLFTSHRSLPRVVEPPSLIVQVVDPNRVPIPEAEIVVNSLSSNAESKTAHTNKDGNAEFWVKADADYVIEAKRQGFKTKRLKHMYLTKPSVTFPTAYVQFQLKLSGPSITVY